MYLHIPPNANSNKAMPIVVVLHGCMQCAGTVATQTGWNKLADEYGFYVLYPEQRIINNPMKCFKWYKRKHIKKNRGENYSIKKMIDYMKANYAIDSSEVYITGLSAGAAMSVIMMVDYPRTFNSGAIFAGAPYKAGKGLITASMAMFGWRMKSPQEWGNVVRKSNPGYTGGYPNMIIYQGNNDWIVSKRNGVELMEQWTNLHNISIQPSETVTQFLNNKDIERNVYRDSINKDVVIFYKVNRLSHALLVNPGSCKTEGGIIGFFAKDKDFHSTLWTAYDFGLITTPVISGKTVVEKGERNISYRVPYTDKSTYEWTFPNACVVIKNDNSNIITLDWGNFSGSINVTETNSLFCKKQYKTLFVNVIDGNKE